MAKFVLAFFVLFVWAAAASAQVAVVAHPSVPVDKIEKGKLLDFYTRDIKKWPDGQAVVVFDLKPKGAVRKRFFKFLGKSSSRMKSIWLKKMLSGEGEPPEAVESEAVMVEKVAVTEGGVGFVGEGEVKGKVKVLLVIGEEE